MTDDRNRRRRYIRLCKQIDACRKCPAMCDHSGNRSAHGWGSINSPVVMVGEALARTSLAHREPFKGGSGWVLERAFNRANIRKADLFITNTVHCRPPDNRDPEPDEIANCEPFLRRELDIVSPRLVIGLGDFAHTALRSIYPDAREAQWTPFAARPDTGRLTRLRNLSDNPVLLMPPHPYRVITRGKPEVERYVTALARALRWAYRP